jgi:hypothetical protein
MTSLNMPSSFLLDVLFASACIASSLVDDAVVDVDCVAIYANAKSTSNR